MRRWSMLCSSDNIYHVNSEVFIVIETKYVMSIAQHVYNLSSAVQSLKLNMLCPSYNMDR